MKIKTIFETTTYHLAISSGPTFIGFVIFLGAVPFLKIAKPRAINAEDTTVAHLSFK